MRRVVFLMLAALAGVVALPAPAQAYVRTKSSGFDVIWPNPAVTMTVRTGGPVVVPVDDFVAAASRAAATWSAPALASSVAYTVVASAAEPADPKFDHENTISFRTSSWDPPLHSDGELALTTVWTQGGRIVDADTEINAADPQFTWAVLPDDPAVAALSPDVDLQNALTHELGHVLGLDHPCALGDPPVGEVTNEGAPVPSCFDPTLPDSVRNATMYPSSTAGSISERTLSADELLALHDLYPEGRAPVVVGPPAPSGGCAVAGSSGPPGVGSFGAAALLLGVWARRRARGRLGRPRPPV